MRLKDLSCQSCSQAVGLVADIPTLAQTRMPISQVVLAFLQYEVQDWQIHFLLKEYPGRHLVNCLTGGLKAVGTNMVPGHLIGWGEGRVITTILNQC